MTLKDVEIPERPLGWKYDLPAAWECPEISPAVSRLEPAPNHVDSVFLELPRSSLKPRGVLAILGGGVMVLSALVILSTLYVAISPAWKLGGEYILLGIGLAFLGCWATIPNVRMDIELPRSEPIRFNRKRRKVYFYQYNYDRFNPLGRRGWGVQPVAYEWDDLVLEACSFYVPMGYGGLLETVWIKVCKPGTDEVIARLFFSNDIDKGEKYWAVARLFMQQGPEALPDFVNRPRDWNSDDGLSPMHCLAPKVQWPAEMDLESRTAPSDN